MNEDLLKELVQFNAQVNDLASAGIGAIKKAGGFSALEKLKRFNSSLELLKEKARKKGKTLPEHGG